MKLNNMLRNFKSQNFIYMGRRRMFTCHVICFVKLESLIMQLCKRYFCSSSNETGQNFKKRKIIAIKKILSVDPNKPVRILESKDASEVMKKINWENKHMFGPVLNSKKRSLSEKKIISSNQIIQHQAGFPMVDPETDLESNIESDCDAQMYSVKQNLNFFDKILNFPLMNKKMESTNSQNKITELNLIRKYLESKCGPYVPSVSAILTKTMPKENQETLERWKQGMIEKVGKEGFEKYQSELFSRGASLHASISSYLSATPEADIVIEKHNLGHWKSLKHVFPFISHVKLLEEKVSHPFLCYKGVVDCFAMYRNHLVVIDWKTSKKTKALISNTFDNPLQIAAYVGALNFDPKFQYLVSKGVIVVAYESGNPATVHVIEEEKMLHYWKEWLKRIKLYWEMNETPDN